MLTGWCLNKNGDKTPNLAFYTPGAPSIRDMFFINYFESYLYISTMY